MTDERLHGDNPRRRRALFLTKYGPRAATTRHRFLQYFPHLDAAGVECRLSPLLSDRYLTRKMEDGTAATGEVVRGIFRRLNVLRDVARFDVVVIHMEALPYLPAAFERTIRRLGVRYVYDFDDASFHQYDRSASPLVRALFGQKIARVIAGASLVVAGNDYLAGYARRHNPHVIVVPTVVDTNVFRPPLSRGAAAPTVIGWIGSPSTKQYVERQAAIWETVTSHGDCVLRLVGSGDVRLPDTRLDLRAWVEAHEVEELQQFDVGIMPLTDDPWARGKCGFKLIEYMACGVPVVASPVGVNSVIVRDGENGFLCAGDRDWVARTRQLVTDVALRHRLGNQGRADAVARWSLERWAPELVRLLRAVADGTALAPLLAAHAVTAAADAAAPAR